jgi:hypothetical protein
MITNTLLPLLLLLFRVQILCHNCGYLCARIPPRSAPIHARVRVGKPPENLLVFQKYFLAMANGQLDEQAARRATRGGAIPPTRRPARMSLFWP